MQPGQQVIANGYIGTVMRHYSGSMFEVRVPGGLVCISDSDIQTDIADAIHSATVRRIEKFHDLTRYQKQEAFRKSALNARIENKTVLMGSVVTRCLALSGHGS